MREYGKGDGTHSAGGHGGTQPFKYLGAHRRNVNTILMISILVV